LHLIRDNPSEFEPGEAGADAAPDMEPPAWKLNRIIGEGSLGTIFLEKVQTRGMKSPELWAVKRISRTLPNFPEKLYKAEIKNLEALSDVSSVATCILSYRVLVSFDYGRVSDVSKAQMVRQIQLLL